jgi:integrase
LRRTKATLIYRRTGNLRAVQLLLGHTKIEHGPLPRRRGRRRARDSGTS